LVIHLNPALKCSCSLNQIFAQRKIFLEGTLVEGNGNLCKTEKSFPNMLAIFNNNVDFTINKGNYRKFVSIRS